MATNWTKDELLAYILLYVANSNFHEDNWERNFIISKVDIKTFQKIHDEFDLDNDYQAIQKIIAGVEMHNYKKDDYKSLFQDISLLVNSDGEYDAMEHNVFLYLKKILTA